MSEVKYPHVEVRLSGQDGDAFMVMGLVQKALRRAGVPDDEVKAYIKEATCGDYDHLLAVTLRTVQVS